MPFEKGVSKTGGRATGTPNKVTSEIRENFQLLIEGNLPKLQTDLDSLEPKDRIAAIVSLAAFVVPKLQAVTLDATIDTDLTFIDSLENLTDDQVEALLLANESNG